MPSKSCTNTLARKENLEAELLKYNQSHLLKFYDELTGAERDQFLHEISELNLDEVTGYFKDAFLTTTKIAEKVDDRLEAIPQDLYGSVVRSTKEELTAYEKIGLEAVSKGEVGVLLLAGGQGTRLGVNYPKGMYDVGLASGKSLYQLQAERILKLEKMAFEHTGRKGTIPWYIMTSEATRASTYEYFQKNKFFGLDEKNLVLFEQGMLPCFTFEGKIILEGKGKISKAPDGNGGLYRALRRWKILTDFEDRGVKYLHVYCVDNILVKVGDPTFVGYCITRNSDCAAKVVEKAFPTEAVGVVCKLDGKFQVVEYSEITLTTAQKRNPNGRLTFNAGNICNHFFTTEFLNRVCSEETKLKHHVAKKKIPYIEESGQIVKPEKPNGIKMEKFVFDVFGLSE
ncbi:hypothetical protein QYM36_001397 [Artemia franciscana]|uniref:UDP-N-acetylglucosamine diphosphorylase n=2 Tax=Artemia franciscana TaxID=6661 RepID=A0AA88IAU8_ARTSF|nr:hypothetical protein QYM36_001397 [Artemia franciscana]